MPRPKKSNRTDGRYEIQRVIGYEINGKAIKKSFYGSSKDDALSKFEDYKRNVQKAEDERKRILFSSWVEQWLETYKKPDVKPSTFLTTYQRPCNNYIIPFFKDVILQDISQINIKLFLNTLTNLSQSLIDKIIICLKGIFETAIDNDLIIKNPCRNISCKSKKEKALKRTYDESSVEYLCSSDHKYSLLINILLKMGLRCSELCGLRWEDVDIENSTLYVKQALTSENGTIYIDEPKSKNSARKLKIPKELIEKLKAEKGTGYIAVLNNRHITPDHFSDRQLESFYNYMKVPKEQRLSPHELRHTCGTLLYEKTKDIYHVSRFLGHSDIGITTKIYVHSEMQEDKIKITPTE